MPSNQDRPLQWPIALTDDEDLVSLEGLDWTVFANDRDSDDASQPPVAITLARAADGRMICTGLIVGLTQFTEPDRPPVEVTSRTLRRIPIAELIGRAVVGGPGPDDQEVDRYLMQLRAPEVRQVRRAPGPKGHPDEHFAFVAEKYRRALEVSPKAPVAWLTKELSADRSTVTRWLRRARDKGYLGESQPGRAGERPSKNEEQA